jgi:catalase
MEDWERDDLINNLVSHLKQCNEDIQERMIGHLTQCDQDYGRRVAEGLGRSINELAAETTASR